MTRSAFAIALVSFAAVVAASASCAGQGRSFTEEPPTGVLETDAEAPPPPDCQGLRCSRDLKRVVDGCTEEVVQECGPEKGCAKGACVDPCTAAEVAKGSTGCCFVRFRPTRPSTAPDPASRR